MTSEPKRHPRQQLLFVLLSVADFVLTWALVNGCKGQAYEANPVAGWWLDRHGWAGLACFKAGAVALVLVLTALVARSRPGAAGRILWFGSGCLAVVAGYSLSLLGVAAWSDDSMSDAQRYLAQVNADSRARWERMSPFRASLREATDATRAGRCTLLEAAVRLAQTELASDHARLRELVPYESDGPPVRWLACLIAANVFGSIDDSEEFGQTSARLDEEFRSAFGVPLPEWLDRFGKAPARPVRNGRPGRRDAEVSEGSGPMAASPQCPLQRR